MSRGEVVAWGDGKTSSVLHRPSAPACSLQYHLQARSKEVQYTGSSLPNCFTRCSDTLEFS